MIFLSLLAFLALCAVMACAFVYAYFLLAEHEDIPPWFSVPGEMPHWVMILAALAIGFMASEVVW